MQEGMSFVINKDEISRNVLEKLDDDCRYYVLCAIKKFISKASVTKNLSGDLEHEPVVQPYGAQDLEVSPQSHENDMNHLVDPTYHLIFLK